MNDARCTRRVATVAMVAFLLWTRSTASSLEASQVIYTKDNPPKTLALEELALTKSVSQYGITWAFAEPARVGQFVNGDYYVVGPVTVAAISPAPAEGRNGSCLNVSAREEKIGFDSRIPYERYEPKLFLATPIALKPGDSLLSSISLEQVGTVKPMLWRIGQDMRSPVRTVAALSCLAAPVPPDAFRPAYCGKQHRIYLARDLRRELLPTLPRQGIPLTCYQGQRNEEFSIEDAIGWCQRPWVDVAMDEFSAPVENMPAYGREFARATGAAGLLLCMDFSSQEKEPLLINSVQVGIDLWGLAREGQPARWVALGGHGNGRKWPIVFAGLMLGDDEMRSPTRTYPQLLFSEDMQTMFGPCWTGAKAVYAGHVGKDGNPSHEGWGAYEHLPPAQWVNDTGESYRRCCTSSAWVAEALAARILHAEPLWDHDAFFAYVDRWMTEDDTEQLGEVLKARGTNYNNDWARQGCVWEPFVKEMWLKYRDHLPAAPDGHHDPLAANTWR